MNSIPFRAAARSAALLALLAFGLLGQSPAGYADAAPPIGAEFAVGSVHVPAQRAQEGTAIAKYADGYLVVWQDKRSGTDYDIYGIFVDPDGNPISDESFLISKVGNGYGAPNDQLLPAVAFNGTNFLVVWTDYRESLQFAHIYGTRITPSGQILDGDGLVISGSGTINYQNAPAIATTGTYWEVVWEENGVDIYGARVTSTGGIGSRTPLAARADNELAPSISWNGSYYLLVWEDYRNAETTGTDIYGILVTSAGAKSGTDKLISSAPGSSTTGASGGQTTPNTAAAGSTWLVTWEDARSGTSKDIYGCRANVVSTVLTPQEVGGIQISATTGDQERPSIGWDGASYMVAWRDTGGGRKIRGTRVNTGGAVLDASGFAISTSSAGKNGPAVAGRSGSCLAAWYTFGTTELDVMGNKVATAAAGPDKMISVSAQDQSGYAAAFDGTNYVVTWSDRSNGGYLVYAARFTSNGTMIDPVAVQVAPPAVGEQVEPAIAWNGSKYLIVWTEGPTTGKDIRGRRFNPDLTPADASPISLANAELDQRSPAVAALGSEFLVAWVDSRAAVAPNYYTDIYGARVNSSGSVLPVSGPICSFTYNQYAPTVAAGGGTYMVAWEDYRSGSPEVYYSRVTSTGTVPAGDANGKRLTDAVASKTAPSLAFGTGSFLIAWADNRTWYNDIFVARLGTDGTKIDASDVAVTTNSSEQASPSVVWDGQNYFVAWQDYRNGTTQNYDIYAARITPTAAVTDPDGFLTSSGTYPETEPAVVAAGDGWGAVFYDKLLYSVNRTVGRTWGEPPALAVSTVAAAKDQPNGTRLKLTDKTVTAGTDQLGGVFYIEEADRTSGIKVVTSDTVQEGKLVTVTGIINTVNGERQIDATSVVQSVDPGTVPGPLGMLVRYLGGKALNADTPGVKDGLGPNNIGLLVRLWGRVKTVGADWIEIDDGGTTFELIPQPIKAKVIMPAGVTPPALNSYVNVTGISSCEPSDADSIRRVLVRKAEDIVTNWP